MLRQRLYSTSAKDTSSGTLIFLLISFFMGIAMGAGVVISRYFGAGDMEQVSKAIHTIMEGVHNASAEIVQYQRQGA